MLTSYFLYTFSTTLYTQQIELIVVCRLTKRIDYTYLNHIQEKITFDSVMHDVP